MKPLRVALVVLGLAVAVYGAASLTGGWLGEPPWGPALKSSDLFVPVQTLLVPVMLSVAGLALACVAWPRRAKPTPPA